MRKRTRKHRGTAGKMVGGFLAFFCLILLTAGMFWAIQGYVSYQKAVKEKPLAQAVEEIRSEAQWVPLKQVPELYKKSVWSRGNGISDVSGYGSQIRSGKVAGRGRKTVCGQQKDRP